MILAYVCQLTGVHDADLKRLNTPGSTAMLERIRRQWRAERHRRGPASRGSQMASQRRVLPAKF